MSITEEISQFIVDSSIEKMPPEAVKMAKQAMMDCLGCTFVGVTEPVGRIITEFVMEMGAKPAASIVGGGRTSAPLAALANGTMAHAVDYDDAALPIIGHPSVCLLPVILALGEQFKASGRELIESYIVGFEVASRLGSAIGWGHYQKGWHGTATLGTMGAAVAGAKLLKLDSEQVRMALGIAASQACGLRQNFGTMTKPFHPGNAAKAGVVAVMLARKGFTADANIIEAPFGFCNVFKGEAYEAEKIVADLGETFFIIAPGIMFKPYPSCLATHTSIEAAMDLARRYNIPAQDIESIETTLNETMSTAALHTCPKTGLEGKFSVEYCITRALLNGKVGLEDFTDARVSEPQAQEIVSKIKRRLDPSFPALATTVDVKLRDGRQFTQRLDAPRPPGYEELVAKYKDCAQFVLSPQDINRSLELLENLESVKDIAELMGIVGKPAV